MIALLLFAGCGGNTSEVSTAVAQSGTFEIILTIPGVFAPESETIVSAPPISSRSKISFIAKQGSLVKKGDILIKFERKKMLAELLDAKKELETAYTQLDQDRGKSSLTLTTATSNIARAKLSLGLAKMQRTDSETVPLADRERARIEQIKSEMAIHAAREGLKSATLDATSSQQLLQLEINQKLRDIAELTDDLEKTTVYAPSDGVVLIKRDWNGKLWTVGREMWVGTPLLALPNMEKMKITCEAHEVDSLQIAVDQTATIAVEAFPDQHITGVVSRVSELAVPKGPDEIKYLEIDLKLPETSPEMRPGLTVSVDLLIERIPNATWIPIEAVRRNDDEPYIWVSSLMGWTNTPVQLGAQNDTHTIVKGLAAGTVVALSDPIGDSTRPE